MTSLDAGGSYGLYSPPRSCVALELEALVCCDNVKQDIQSYSSPVGGSVMAPGLLCFNHGLQEKYAPSHPLGKSALKPRKPHFFRGRHVVHFGPRDCAVGALNVAPKLRVLE